MVRSKVRIALLPLGCGPRLQCPSCLGLIGDDLHLLSALGANKAPVANQPNCAEQVAFDHLAEEARSTLLRITPVEHQVIPYGRAGIGLAIPYSGLPFWSAFSISRIMACSISSRLTLTVSPLAWALARVTGTCLVLGRLTATCA